MHLSRGKTAWSADKKKAMNRGRNIALKGRSVNAGSDQQQAGPGLAAQTQMHGWQRGKGAALLRENRMASPDDQTEDRLAGKVMDEHRAALPVSSYED